MRKGSENFAGKLAASIRRWLERLSPYQALLVLIIPAAIVEPLKLIAVAIVGSGHWLTGTVAMVVAYLASFFGIHRLFLILKPRLLEIRWFAMCWSYFVRLRRTMWPLSSKRPKRRAR